MGDPRSLPEGRALSISGALTVRAADELGRRIREAVAGSPSLMLDISDVAEADLSFVQLVESVRRSAERDGAQVRLARPAEGALLAVLERGGFLDPSSPERAAFWTHPETGQ